MNHRRPWRVILVRQALTAGAATVLWTLLMVFGFGDPFRWGASLFFFGWMYVVYVAADRWRPPRREERVREG